MDKELKGVNLLGYTVKDIITGTEGVVTGYVSYISGCNQYLVAPRKKGAKSQWFDEQRIEVLAEPARIVLDNEPAPGHDRSAPRR